MSEGAENGMNRRDFLKGLAATAVTAGLGVENAAEAQESMDFAKEANAFLDKIAAEEPGIDDAQGSRTMRTKIEMHFNTLALAFNKRTPVFSEGRSISGNIDQEMRDAAQKHILPRLLVRPDLKDNLGLLMLQELLTHERVIPPLDFSPLPKSDFGDGLKAGPSEIRRNRTQDW